MRWAKRTYQARDQQVDAELWFIVVRSGVPAGERLEYVAFARELFRFLRRGAAPDAGRVTGQAILRWSGRGLKDQYLQAVSAEVRAWLFPQEVRDAQGP
jgi:hypothetical protein